MVISQIMGGLGNQLGEYACGYSLAKQLGQELVLDVSDYICRGYFRPYCLDKLQIGHHRKLVYPPVSFKFMEPECVPEELTEDYGLRIINLSEVGTREELLKAADGAENIYLMGYGGMHYATPEDQEEIREKYQMKEPALSVEQFKNRIREEYSVAVHIRRTDFVDLKCESSMEYFRAAITYIRIFHPDAQFYFFSDDIKFAMEQFGAYDNYHYVHLLGGMDADLEEFFCLEACDGRILSAKSTFGAWASELNQKDGKLDVCQDALGGRNSVCLNQAAVSRLCGWYQPESGVSAKADVLAIVNTAFNLAAEGRNNEAIETIDRACFDSFGFIEEDICKLTALKEIALVQKGEEGLSAALRAFYEQMQRDNGDPAFHTDYFRVLYQAGRMEESAIHAAMANRLGDQENYQEYFDEIGKTSYAAELYRYLKNNPPRHFIFAIACKWNYNITYMESLAVFLARMGQKVTLLEEADISIGTEGSVSEIARMLLQSERYLDSNYNYHVNTIYIPKLCLSEKKAQSLFQELIRQCALQFDLEIVVVTTMPTVFSPCKVEKVKYVVPDICDPLNCERIFLKEDLASYIVYMADRADVIFLSGSVFETVRKLHGSKVHRAFSTWKSNSKYQFLDKDIDFTPNYIHSDEMMWNAAELLRI